MADSGFRYPFAGRMPGVDQNLQTGLADNFRRAATKEQVQDHIDDAAAAHAASAISVTPTGLIVATDVQAALAEIDSEKIEKSLLTTRGDIITRSAAVPQRLALGASGLSPVSDGTDLVYGKNPTEAAWRTIMQAQGFAAAGSTSGTYLFVAGTAIIAVAGNSNGAPMIRINAADFAATGRTTRMRVQFMETTNATNPSCIFTAGLYPLSSNGGGAGTVVHSVGTVVSGSTVAHNIGASAQAHGSAAFDIPSDGYYLLGVALNATTAASSRVSLSCVLQVAHS